MNYKQVSYENQDYAILTVNYRDTKLPVLLDWSDFQKIKKLNKKWKCNNSGFVYCQQDNTDYYLHELVMSFKEGNIINRPIIHVNRVGLDNRSENLIYDVLDKDITKNAKKKKRTVVLPKKCGICPDDIPTYIWYMRPDSSHGERFTVNIGDINWKTTSSNEFSLRYKLEEAKMFLRHLLKSRPDLYNEYSMNGDFNKDGINLLNSYYKIIHDNGFNNIKKVIPQNKTFDLLKADYSYLTSDELESLKEVKGTFY